MTTFAAGSKHGLSYATENVFGTTITTRTPKALRYVTSSVQLAKDTFQSREIRSDRQITDFRHGTYRVEGDVAFEYSWAEFDSLFEATLGGTWQSSLATITGASIGAKTTGAQFYSATVTFTTLTTGDVVRAAGFTGSAISNNGIHVVTSAKQFTIGVASTLASVAAGASKTFKRQSSLRNGVVDRSLTIERRYTDIGWYERLSGCVMNGLDLSLKPNAIVTGTLRVMGKATLFTQTALTTPTASQTGSPYDTFAGAVKEAGSAVAYITGIDFKLENNGENAFVIGSQSTQAIVLGRCNITGTIEVFLQNATMANKFVNETESSLEFDIGGTTNYYKVFLPRVKFGGADHPTDKEGILTIRMPFQALYSQTYLMTAQFTKIV